MSLYISHIAQRDETLGTVGSQSVAQGDVLDIACCTTTTTTTTPTPTTTTKVCIVVL